MNRVWVFFLLGILPFGNSNIFAQANTHEGPPAISSDSLCRGLDEVAVSPLKVSKRIIDIPCPVVRLNYVNYKYDRKIGCDGILSSVPGLFLQSRYGDQDVRFSARGFGSRSTAGVRGIQVTLDDIPESEPDGQTRLDAIDFNAIGHIEIVKGNSSSLYTNAPGGVAGFFNDLGFDRSSVVQFNQFGSFGLHQNGFKAAVKTANYRVLTTYSYINYDGYRQHNTGFRHVLNMVIEATPSAHTKLSILGYFVDGACKLPGSLTREEFQQDPWQADPMSVTRDEKRITTRGRVGIRYDAVFGGNLNNEVEVTFYGTIKYFNIADYDYRVINRYGFGLNARYINKALIGARHNECSIGIDLLSQPSRTAIYKNLKGVRGDMIDQVESEHLSGNGIYISDNFELLKEKLFMLLTCRYDNVKYKLAEETLPLLSESRIFNAVKPKLALNYKIAPAIAVYTSFGWSFDSPAADELRSTDPDSLLNKDLKAQESRNFEVGIKGDLVRGKKTFLNRFLYEATFFNSRIYNEIVPYEVSGEFQARNAASANRLGMELGAHLELFEGFTLGLTYTWSHFEYLTYETKVFEADTAGVLAEADKVYSGNTEPGVPANNVNVSIAYSRSLNNHFGFFVKAGCQGISGFWVDDANTVKTSPVNLLNGLLGIDLKFGKFSMMASGGIRNIFDEVYVGFTNTNAADMRYYEAGAPRNYFVSLNLGYTF
ncbi:MAG: TonB-dependent receptor [Bacteroidetes bacterium]|nr:TonB-dependent receptor [Bacteroidota bacterium]